jgi:hypothetical protein
MPPTDHGSRGDDGLQQEMGIHLSLGRVGFFSHGYFLPSPGYATGPGAAYRPYSTGLLWQFAVTADDAWSARDNRIRFPFE